jgi:LDH2 family malate/lactate/ureidoglycolate dehydrogenase
MTKVPSPESRPGRLAPAPSIAPSSAVIRIHEGPLRDYCRDLLTALGVPDAHARIVGDSLVAANLRGVDSHGIQMIGSYIAHLQAGGVDAAAAGCVVSESGACLIYDGQNGLGQVVADHCTDHAVRVVRGSGLALVVARNSNHFGAAGYWAQKVARSGYIGIAMCNAAPAIPPWQGRSPRFGTNPIGVAVPAGDKEGWVLDMATSTVALGKLGNAAYHGEATIPASWGFLDANGNPTTDTKAAQQGRQTPIGGYKGSGLAMMVEILSAGLGGGPMASEVPYFGKGAESLRISHTFMAIDPARFMPLAEFEARLDRLNGLVKSSEPAPGFNEVLVAGEPEWRAERERRRDGIPIPLSLWEKLGATAKSIKVTPPQTR